MGACSGFTSIMPAPSLSPDQRARARRSARSPMPQLFWSEARKAGPPIPRSKGRPAASSGRASRPGACARRSRGSRARGTRTGGLAQVAPAGSRVPSSSSSEEGSVIARVSPWASTQTSRKRRPCGGDRAASAFRRASDAGGTPAISHCRLVARLDSPAPPVHVSMYRSLAGRSTAGRLADDRYDEPFSARRVDGTCGRGPFRGPSLS